MAGMALVAQGTSAYAQPAMPSALRDAARQGIDDEQRDRQRRDADERTRQADAPDVRLDGASLPGSVAVSDAAEGVDTVLPTETPCFVVHRITLRPESGVGFLPSALQPYVGQCVGQDGIGRITAHASRVLVEHGLVTPRVLVPTQDLRSGELTLEILPGRVGEIRFSDPPSWGTWRNAMPLREGDWLVLAGLEQGVEQLKRVPSQDAGVRLAPGRTPGESDIVIDVVRHRPWRVMASVDNAGARDTGRLQGQLAVGVDSPLGLSDLLDVSVQHDLSPGDDRFGTKGLSASYSVPWGYNTVSVFGTTRRYFQRVAGANQTFLSSGRSQLAEVKVERVVHRDRNGKTSLEARLSRRFGRSHIEDFEIQQQYRNNTFYQLGVAHRRYVGAAQFDIYLGWRQGVPWFGAQPELRNRFTGEALRQTYRYRMALLDAQMSVPFRVGGVPLRYSAVFHGQTTASALWATDQLTIGSRFTVRGFDGETMLSAERGFFLRNELQAPVGATSHAVYVGVDYGQVHGFSARHLPGTRLAGAVIGLRGYQGGRLGGFRYDVFVGTPLHKPAGFPTGKVCAGFAVSYRY
ncbi:Hemolysin transporter protein ShlB [Pandoraea terrae]|uniref:Hemolysin transporter protein ShlB n=2 Tax=Pandoraea terrae TaxID=1537710 RepID=A0A5E4YVC5_9BURK|nr:Hemolysin transporter protein ShlB [Pandoraea terrae]